MRICIHDKKKKEIFVSLFQVFKNCTATINATFEAEQLYIQGLDKSHVCLFETKIHKNWFAQYETTTEETLKLAFDANSFHSIISTKSDHQNLIIETDDKNDDILLIYFASNAEEQPKKEYKKSFKLPLSEYDYEEMHIPSVEYDAEFSLSSKEIADICSQLSNFGNDIIIHCSNDNVRLTTNGLAGEMRVDIPVDDLTSYSVVEDEEIVLTYSLVYIHKMCITNKLSPDIDFSLSNQCPMKIKYDLGDESSLIFYIAPKSDE
jgi:proliferating cell nuclear antigen PCNA